MTDNHDDGVPNRADNRDTYSAFMTVTKWGVILVVLALVLMAVFLV